MLPRTKVWSIGGTGGGGGVGRPIETASGSSDATLHEGQKLVIINK